MDQYFVDAFACDSCPKVRDVLETNFRDLHTDNIFHDVLALDFHKIKREHPHLDIFTAGFPCQPFSGMGLGRGTSDSRGTIGFSVICSIKNLLPRTFILENVSGLKQSHPATFNQILNELANIKTNGKAHYRISWKMLNSRLHAGVPQNRPRLYIIGIAQDLVSADYTFTWPGQV